MRARASILIGLAALIVVLAVWGPVATADLYLGSDQCALPCNHPLLAVGPVAPAPNPVPQACLQSADCGGGGGLAPVAGAGLFVLAVTAWALERAGPRTLRRRARRRDQAPAGFRPTLLRPPRFA